MYIYPISGKDYKTTINLELLEELEAQVSDTDLDLCVPQNTLILYGDLLQQGEYPKEFSYQVQIYKKAYVYLRERVWGFVENGGELELLGTLSDAAEWIEAHADQEIEQHRSHINGNQQMDINSDYENETSLEIAYDVTEENSYSVDELLLSL